MSSSETLAEMSTWCVTCKLGESACTAQPSRLAVPGWEGASNGPVKLREISTNIGFSYTPIVLLFSDKVRRIIQIKV